MTPLMIHDETADGAVLNQVCLWLEHDSITVEELLRLRIEQEAKDFHGESTEGVKEALFYQQRAGAHIALGAFREHGFILFIDNRQVDSLEEQIKVSANTSVRFVQCLEKNS